MSVSGLSTLNAQLLEKFSAFLSLEACKPGEWVFDARVLPLNKSAPCAQANLFAGWHARLTWEDDRFQLQDVLVGISPTGSHNWQEIPMSPGDFTLVWQHFKQTRAELFDCIRLNRSPFTEHMRFADGF